MEFDNYLKNFSTATEADLSRVRSTSISALEKIIRLARIMPPVNQSGDWGTWSIDRVRCVANLISNFGDGKIITSFILGEDRTPNMRNAKFDRAIGYWNTVRTQGNFSTTFTNALIALYPSNYMHMRPGSEEENNYRRFYFYQSFNSSVLTLQQLGSPATGWWSVDNISQQNMDNLYPPPAIKLEAVVNDIEECGKYHYAMPTNINSLSA